MTSDFNAKWAESALTGLDVVDLATLAAYRLVWEELGYKHPQRRALEHLINVMRRQVVTARAVLAHITVNEQ